MPSLLLVCCVVVMRLQLCSGGLGGHLEHTLDIHLHMATKHDNVHEGLGITQIATHCLKHHKPAQE